MFAACTIDAEGPRLQDGEHGDVPWWSFTKLVIASSALKLVEQNELDLDGPLADRPYTLRQLLKHEAGLPDYGWLEDYQSAVAAGTAPWSPQEMIGQTLEAYPPWQPGTRWAYSNIGFYHVGELIRAATGTMLGEALAELALTPAGLTSARIVESASDLRGVQMGNAEGYDPRWVLHGLLVGPISEAAAFLHALLSGAILAQSTLAEMFKVRLLPQFRDELWEHPAYGLGLMGAWDGPQSPCGHSGEGPGSGIGVYGCTGIDGVRVAARWESPGTARSVETAVVAALRRS